MWLGQVGNWVLFDFFHETEIIRLAVAQDVSLPLGASII